VASLVARVDDDMRSFGFDEKLVVRSQLLTCRLSGCRLLTPKEQAVAAAIIIAGLREKLPQYDLEFESCHQVVSYESKEPVTIE
jgi:hypothetical protein